MTRHVATLFLALLGTASAGCEPDYNNAAATDRPPVKVGEKVTVQFRRDALGAAAALPVSPLMGSINGAAVAISGTVEETRPGWVLIDTVSPSLQNSKGQSVHEHRWIPLSVVLTIDRLSTGGM